MILFKICPIQYQRMCLVIFLVAFSACTERPEREDVNLEDENLKSAPIDDERACKNQGGEWDRFTLWLPEEKQYRCNLPTTDAGAVCQASSDCHGYCESRTSIEEDPSPEFGNCSSKSFMSLGCHGLVEAGQLVIVCND